MRMDTHEAWEQDQVMRQKEDPVQAALLTALLDIDHLKILLFLSPL